MPNLINTDSAGNVFYNYITPVVKGELQDYSTLDTFFQAKLGASGISWQNLGSETYRLKFPAPDLETKTGDVSLGDNYARFIAKFSHTTRRAMNSNTSPSGGNWIGGLQADQPGGGYLAGSPYMFAVINDYSLAYVFFSNATLTSLVGFLYLGWLREPAYTGGVASSGLVTVAGNLTTRYGVRPVSPNSSVAVLSSVAADAITSPPIVCTAGTDPGDDSETATDIVIRDAAAPNNPVGKLWNCIDLPATTAVGDLVKNVGAYDGDGDVSEQDVYLCVMDWGTRKLGMRVWTEGVT